MWGLRATRWPRRGGGVPRRRRGWHATPASRPSWRGGGFRQLGVRAASAAWASGRVVRRARRVVGCVWGASCDAGFRAVGGAAAASGCVAWGVGAASCVWGCRSKARHAHGGAFLRSWLVAGCRRAYPPAVPTRRLCVSFGNLPCDCATHASNSPRSLSLSLPHPSLSRRCPPLPRHPAPRRSAPCAASGASLRRGGLPRIGAQSGACARRPESAPVVDYRPPTPVPPGGRVVDHRPILIVVPATSSPSQPLAGNPRSAAAAKWSSSITSQMDAMEELAELADTTLKGAALLADDDPSADCPTRRASSFLTAVAIGNIGAGKSAVLNGLIGHPVLCTSSISATSAVFCDDFCFIPVWLYSQMIVVMELLQGKGVYQFDRYM
ncbi:hypothetical protein U9M48_041790 [Paspalum notatum var. saurae]